MAWLGEPASVISGRDGTTCLDDLMYWSRQAVAEEERGQRTKQNQQQGCQTHGA